MRSSRSTESRRPQPQTEHGASSLQAHAAIGIIKLGIIERGGSGWVRGAVYIQKLFPSLPCNAKSTHQRISWHALSVPEWSRLRIVPFPATF